MIKFDNYLTLIVDLLVEDIIIGEARQVQQFLILSTTFQKDSSSGEKNHSLKIPHTSVLYGHLLNLNTLRTSQ